MIACIPVSPDGEAGGGWGRAARVAVAEVQGGEIVRWDVVEVGWDVLHDEGTEGGHHARIARFLADHRIELVVAGHMGPPMVVMLGRMGIEVLQGAAGDARQAVLAATGSAAA